MDRTEKSMDSPNKTESIGRDIKGRFSQGNMIGKGRPVLGESVAQLIRDLGSEEITVKEAQIKLSRLEATLRRAWVDAMGGNKDAREFIFERGWGKAIQPLLVDSVQGDLLAVFREMNSERLDQIIAEARQLLEGSQENRQDKADE